jgi:hypothetical protein
MHERIAADGGESSRSIGQPGGGHLVFRPRRLAGALAVFLRRE